MSHPHDRTPWEFLDDRAQLASAPERPRRVVTYVQAGAALWDHGIRPAGVFGSPHDDETTADPAKTGRLPMGDVPYLGAGAGLDVGTLLAAEPDLLVAVTYGGSAVYAIAPETAKHLEEHVPVVALSVAADRGLTGIRERFAELAHALGAPERPEAAHELDAAEGLFRAAAASAGDIRITAVSSAGPDQVYVARPHTWSDLTALHALGATLPEPPDGPGINWHTTTWDEVISWQPDIVLTDARAHAGPTDPALAVRTRLLPWNPELPPSPDAHARFLTGLAEALRDAARSRK